MTLGMTTMLSKGTRRVKGNSTNGLRELWGRGNRLKTRLLLYTNAPLLKMLHFWKSFYFISFLTIFRLSLAGKKLSHRTSIRNFCFNLAETSHVEIRLFYDLAIDILFCLKPIHITWSRHTRQEMPLNKLLGLTTMKSHQLWDNN